MLALVLGLHLFQQPVCAPEATVLVTEASLRAAEFDLPVAARQLRSAVAQGCASAEVGALFLQGLVDAREAFRQGGTPASLVPVRQAIASLDMLAKERQGPAGIARLTLYAAAAAAQSERDEMRLYLEAAMRMELLQRAANQPGAPLITPAEVADDLWLQVHGYQEAWQSYVTASQQVGPVLRVLAGIARATARLNDAASACGAFRSLVEEWGVRQAEPPEIGEARAYLRRPACMRAGP